MSRSNELHVSYLNSLNMFTVPRTAGKIKAGEKMNDELTLKKSNNVPQKNIPGGMPAFPLTANMLLLSFLFWLILSVLIYYCVTYGLMLTKVTQEADLQGQCRDVFSKQKAENMRRIENYTVGDALPYLLRMRTSKKEDYPVESKTLPPLVTGITTSQFYQFQGLVKHIEEDLRPSHPDLKLIVYDLGLSSRTKQLVRRYCNCEVRDFRAEQYPSHVSAISNFSWRPIIILHTLEEYGSVLYVEPTTRFKNPSALNYIRMRGLSNYFVWDAVTYTSLVAYTDKRMFEYFNESRCAFKDCSLLSPEAIAVYRTEASWTELMKPWLVCALNEQCIAPSYARYSGCIELRHPRTTGCHRYDMSALSIILNRAVQYTIDSEQVVSFRLTHTDLDGVTYFPDQPWTYTKLLLFVITPLLFVIAHKLFYKKKRLYRL